MLEKPNLDDAKIINSLRDEYGLDTVHVAFLPLGADMNSAVYRAVTADETPYFVKLRREVFDETAAIIPKLLSDQGVRQVIAPMPTPTGRLWVNLDEYKLTVSLFVEGHGGFEVDLSDQNWVEFGRALKSIHTAVLPASILSRIPQERYSAHWREMVRRFQAQAENTPFADPVAAELAAFLKLKRDDVNRLIKRAEDLAMVLQTRSLPFILCHADIHVGNLLIDTHDRLYIIDWDTLTLAPKERDLMFVGGGLGGGGHTAEQEEALFYQGYDQTEIDLVALAYYRYERIVQDIAAYCEQLLLTDEGGDDREQGLQQLTYQFQPNQVVEMAYRTEKSLPPELQAK